MEYTLSWNFMGRSCIEESGVFTLFGDALKERCGLVGADRHAESAEIFAYIFAEMADQARRQCGSWRYNLSPFDGGGDGQRI